MNQPAARVAFREGGKVKSGGLVSPKRVRRQPLVYDAEQPSNRRGATAVAGTDVR